MTKSISIFLLLVFLTFISKAIYAQKLAPESMSYSSYGVDASGNLYAWGRNNYGQLGIGNTTDQYTPVVVTLPSGVTSWTAVAGGFYHSLAIGSDGNLYAWGFNGYGQLGIGNTTDQHTPVKVTLPSGVTSWTAVASGFYHSLAIGSDGNLYAWGWNGYGQLGIGNTTDQYTPVVVTKPSGVTSWTAVVVGYAHSLAIGSDGNLYAWGYNGYGQLGNGNTTNQSTPVVVTLPSGVTGWTAVAGGYDHSLAIGSDGNLYDWGYNGYGQLGNNTSDNSPHSTPAHVLGVGGSGNLLLPVELQTFTAFVFNNNVELNWTTATEVNNYGFEVERKPIPNPSQREGALGFVAGAGNSNSPHDYSFTDQPTGGTSFSYRLKQIDIDGGFKYYDAVTVSLTSSTIAELMQNSPNPFNPSTAIKFFIPNNSDVTIKIYDMLGREVTTLINNQTTAGYHIVYWNGRDSYGMDAASGVYLYRLTAGPSTSSGQAFTETKKMVLVK